MGNLRETRIQQPPGGVVNKPAGRRVDDDATAGGGITG
jgi:hypothetical protein